MLETVTSTELIEELKSRCGTCLVIYELESRGDPDTMETMIAWGGGHHAALGLAMRAQHQLLRSDDLETEDGV